MPYYVQKHAGLWPQGTVIENDADFEQHPFQEKFLRNGSVVKMSDATAREMQSPGVDTARLAEIDAQIAQLQAERAQVVGQGPEPNAPAAVAYEIKPDDQPTAQEADANRAAGKEVVQPTDENVNVGEVVPGEAAEKPKAGRK
jgi:hypothetical protein